MNKAWIKSMYVVMKKSMETAILDGSLPLILIIMVAINIYALRDSEVLFSKHSSGITNDPLYMSSLFTSFLVMAYGSYLGNKFFSRDIENRRINSLFLIPEGIKPVYFGKLLGGATVLGVISLLFSLHMFITVSYWGSISYLTMGRLLVYSTLMFIASMFLFLLVVVAGMMFRKSMPAMFFSSAYLILSFFMVYTVETPEETLSNLAQVSMFPVLNLRYNILFLAELGVLPINFILVPLLSILWGLGMSYMLSEGARS